jgi:hypothetical protein
VERVSHASMGAVLRKAWTYSGGGQHKNTAVTRRSWRWSEGSLPQVESQAPLPAALGRAKQVAAGGITCCM